MKHNLPGVILLFLFGTCFFTSHSQSIWTKTFGGVNFEEGYSTQQTNDGGYIVTGYTSSFGAGNSDVWLIKTNNNGDTLWTRTFGGTSIEEGVYVQQTVDNGYIITGYTSSYGGGNYDIWLIKTNSAGDSLWTKTFGGSNNEYGTTVQQTSDDGYIIIGSTESYGAGFADIYLIKTNEDGDTSWTKTFGGQYNDIGFSGQQTLDGGYVITGYKQPAGFTNSDVWVIKTDSNGEISWTKSWGGELNELANSIQQTADNGYIITGYTSSYGAGSFDVWLIKTDSNGDTLWTKTYGGEANDVGNTVLQTEDNGYIFCGYTYSYSTSGNGDADIWIIKTDSFGDTLWTKTFGGSANDVAYSIQQTAEGKYIVSGFTESFGAGDKDIWLLLVDHETQTVIELSNSKTDLDLELEQNFPNPFYSATTINYSIPSPGDVSLNIYDLSGKIVASIVNDYKNAGNHSAEFINNDLKEGVYFYRLQSGDLDKMKKFILSR